MTTPETIAEARRDLGRQLAAYRKAGKFKTQSAFAKLFHITRSSIANIETGRQRVDRGFWERCDEILGTRGALTARYDEIQALEKRNVEDNDQVLHRRDAAAGDGERLPGSCATSRSDLAVPERWQPSATVDRRGALLGGIAAVAAASGILGQRQDSGRRRIGAGDVTRLNAITALYRSVDYEHGGGMLCDEVSRFAESASLLLEGECAESTSPSLLTAVAAARQLAGWTAFDAGRHADAARHLLWAERAAVRAGDRRFAARVRYCQARQWQHLHHNQDALNSLRLARADLGTAATPAITAMLCGAQAASLAALGRPQEAFAALSVASDAFDRVDPENEPDWMGFFDRGEVLAQYGRVYRDLARQDRRFGPDAVRWVNDAIAAFEPTNVRSSVLNEVGLCSALFLAGAPTEAVAVGRRMIDRAGQLTSERIFDRIRNVGRDIISHRSLSEVSDFAHALTTISPAST